MNQIAFFREEPTEIQGEGWLPQFVQEEGIEVPKQGVLSDLDVGLRFEDVELGDEAIGRKHVILPRDGVVHVGAVGEVGVHLSVHVESPSADGLDCCEVLAFEAVSQPDVYHL